MRRLEEWPFTTEFGLQAHLHKLNNQLTQEWLAEQSK